MTREKAKEICEMIETHGIEVIKAYGEGKVIQHLNLDGEWVDCDMPISFSNNHSFRIKPEMNKKDIFYYAKLHKIPIYFQPDDNEVVGRNVFCDFLLWLIQPFEPLFVSEEGFKIEIEHRTITKDELREKGLLEE